MIGPNSGDWVGPREGCKLLGLFDEVKWASRTIRLSEQLGLDIEMGLHKFEIKK